MNQRRERILRAAALASEAELRAETRLAAASRRLSEQDAKRRDLLLQAAAIDPTATPPALQGELTRAGARRLDHLADERLEQATITDRERAELVAARTRTRSLERLAQRLAAAANERIEAAELEAYRDLIAVHAARDLAARRAPTGRAGARRSEPPRSEPRSPGARSAEDHSAQARPAGSRSTATRHTVPTTGEA